VGGNSVTTSVTNSFYDDLLAYRAGVDMQAWSGTLLEYLALVAQQPSVARLAHGRLYDSIMEAGVTEHEDGIPRYNFFEDELFGLERPIAAIMNYLKSSANGEEIRKRILMLMGPVGGGKSTIATKLKAGLERHSLTAAGAAYAIKGCEMHEEPLHLIPAPLRTRLMREHSIIIEGDLCPQCNFWVQRSGKDFPGQHPWGDDFVAGSIEDVPVERIFFSEKDRIGIGTFQPSDTKNQNQSELTGSIDFSRIASIGAESDPRAYRFDGELNVANRGMVEFVEMLKVGEQFLHILLTLAQEQKIKTERFPLIYADEFILAHTNENEYQEFVGNRKREALQDRIVLIKVPYNLRVKDEVRIYSKLLTINEHGRTRTGAHIAPHTLQTSAMFAILTRLEESKKLGMSLMKKLKLYNGDPIEGDSTTYTAEDVRELRQEAVREGMDGLSSRYTVNRLLSGLSKEIADENGCLNPLDALRSLRDGLETNPAVTREHKDRYMNMIAQARADYDERAKLEVQRAFVHAYDDSTRTLLNNYLDNIEASVNKAKVRDPLTDDLVEPDEKLMRSIEEQVGISEVAKNSFRQEILLRVAGTSRKGQPFTVDSHPRLKEALERKLFSDMKDLVKITTSVKTPDAEQQERIQTVVDRLITEHGYCDKCAKSLLSYVGALLAR
jgi:serine protein kinase